MTDLKADDVAALGGELRAPNRLAQLIKLIEKNGGFLKDAELGRTLGPNPDLTKIINIPGVGIPAFQFKEPWLSRQELTPDGTPAAYAEWLLHTKAPFGCINAVRDSDDEG